MSAAHASPSASARQRTPAGPRLVRRPASETPPPSSAACLLAHRPALTACARRLLGSTWEAEAVVEEALASAGEALALFRPSSGVGPWLQGLVVGATLTRLRSASRAPEPPWPGPLEQDGERIADPDDGTLAEALTDVDQRMRLEELSALLPVPVRAVFVLVDLEGLPLEAAARVLGIGPERARERLARARSALAAWSEDADAAAHPA